jgi:antitoxin component YwqK of YwqJK toxin-antitoxin module
LENKTPRNANGNPHGRWETYYSCGSWWKAHYVNGVELGFSKYWFKDDGKLTYNEYYAK